MSQKRSSCRLRKSPDFVCGSINKRFPHTIRKRDSDGSYSLRNGKEISDALRALMSSYPATHYARTEISRFRNQLIETISTAISFGEDRENHEFVHTRHPLVLMGTEFRAREGFGYALVCG